VRREIAGVLCVVVLTACGGGSLTLSEYAAEAEDLVEVMTAEFGALDAEWESQPPSLEGARSYWEGRLAIRAEFLDAVRTLNPPDSVEAQHEAALDVFDRITAADQALAARVATFESISGHWEWVDTPEGEAAEAVLEEVYAFCRASQAEYDATKDLEPLADVPWLPSEASEVVSVAFGCPP